MNLSRIAYLFPVTESGHTADDRRRLVLTAVAYVVKNKAAALTFRVSLTDRLYASLSEILAVLPTTPAEGSPYYCVEDVIDTLRELHEMDYIDQHKYNFFEISLTNNLFHEIAREWATALGIDAYAVFGDNVVMASCSARAEAIGLAQIGREYFKTDKYLTHALSL